MEKIMSFSERFLTKRGEIRWAYQVYSKHNYPRSSVILDFYWEYATKYYKENIDIIKNAFKTEEIKYIPGSISENFFNQNDIDLQLTIKGRRRKYWLTLRKNDIRKYFKKILPEEDLLLMEVM